jgi:hypothetical protein
MIACSDSTPVGSIDCIGERIRCGPTAAQLDQEIPAIEPPRDLVSSTGLEVLMPASHARPFPEALEAQVFLTADANGDLWSISSHDSRVVLTKIDRNGSTVEEHVVDPPRGTRDPEHLQAQVTLQAGSPRSRATLIVYWVRGCDGRAADPPDCQLTELLVFDDFAKAPRRIALNFGTLTEVQANESGQWIIYGYTQRIEKLDARGNLVWSQTGFVAGSSQELPSISRGALRANNQLSALLVFGGGYEVGLELWLLNAAGNIEARRPLAWSGQSPEHAIDARGRDVIAGMTTDDDLILMRVFEGRSEGNVIAREEFLSLRPDGLAVDSAGAAYVATTAGGREPKDWRAVLCQLPDVGRVRCFTLGDIAVSNPATLIDALVVPEPGVVYVRSGSDLRRYELPEQ